MKKNLRVLLRVLVVGWLMAGSRPATAQAGWGAEWTRNLGPYAVGSVDFKEKLTKAMDGKNYIEAERILIRWEAAQPTNPEPYMLHGTVAAQVKDYGTTTIVLTKALGCKTLSAGQRYAILIDRAEAWNKLSQYGRALTDTRALLTLEERPLSHNNLAWMLATCPDASIRNGPEALREATLAVNEAKKVFLPDAVDTLAAAQAETRDFTTAVQSEKKALNLCQDPKDKPGMQRRLALYQHQQPYRTDPKIED